MVGQLEKSSERSSGSGGATKSEQESDRLRVSGVLLSVMRAAVLPCADNCRFELPYEGYKHCSLLTATSSIAAQAAFPGRLNTDFLENFPNGASSTNSVSGTCKGKRWNTNSRGKNIGLALATAASSAILGIVK